MRFSISTLFCLVIIAQAAVAQRIIPQPLVLESSGSTVSLPAQSRIYADKTLEREMGYITQLLRDEFGLEVEISSLGESDIKLLSTPSNESSLGAEGYELTVSREGIVISASHPPGVFYGIQSLRQLIEKAKTGAGYFVTSVYIKDKPRFGWRSFMLDEGRYFKGKEDVKVLLDEMALLKMNIFHWHLTEDQGWRLAIEKYPLLTEVGSKRDSTQIGGWDSPRYDGTPHAGYYTQDDIREIIRYAADRHITIIPEIEMPGHSSAAIAAYPWLGVSKEPINVPTSFGVKYDTYDVSDPKVIGFLHDVLEEVIALFPSSVIHIGGDEVKYDHWLASPSINEYMKKHNLPSPADLQIAFTNDISNFLTTKGKRMMGWNDILGAKLHEYNADTPPASGKLSPETIIHFWKGDLSLINEALEKGYDIVNSFHSYTYLDYNHEAIPLEKAYGFEPIPENVDEKYHMQILGLGAQMWSEWIPKTEDMYRQTFPRLAAYAEVAWTATDNKDFGRFLETLAHFKKHWNDKGIMYFAEPKG